MFQLERKEKVLQYINDNKIVTTKTLCEVFHTTPVTIRADIASLAQNGLVIKTHGGAMSVENRMNIEIPIARKIQMNVREKQLIAQAAAAHIHPGDTIILDSGSTTLEIAKKLKGKTITVITNDVLIAKTLIDLGGPSVLVAGGQPLNSVYALHGADTEAYFSRVHVNKLFLGCDAVDVEWGISNRTIGEVATKRAMMHASQEIIAVADGSKLNRRVFAKLCEISEVDALITDAISDQDRERLETQGVQVECCGEGKA